MILLSLLFSLSVQAGSVSKCQDLTGSTSATASFTPANGEVVFFQRLSASATSATGSKGGVFWDGSLVEAWTGDKVVVYGDNEAAYTFTGDGVKKLELKIENTSASTVYRVCGNLAFKTSLE